MATLVHDDVLDEAPLRRGHPTVWATHGRAVAVATGDYLFARAFARARGARRPRCDPHRLARRRCELAQGEALQAEQARDPGVSPEAVLERCRLKTGRLFAAACALGGRLGGLDPDACAALDRFGAAARPGLPARRRRARLRRRPEAHGQDRSAPTCSTARRRCRCCSPRDRTRRSPARCASRSRRADVLPPALARRRDWRARPRPAILPSGTRNAPRPSSSGHRGSRYGSAACAPAACDRPRLLARVPRPAKDDPRYGNDRPHERTRRSARRRCSPASGSTSTTASRCSRATTSSRSGGLPTPLAACAEAPTRSSSSTTCT